MFTEYFLEDCIQMTQFVPPPSDKKRKDKDEEGGEEEVCKSIGSSDPECYYYYYYYQIKRTLSDDKPQCFMMIAMTAFIKLHPAESVL